RRPRAQPWEDDGAKGPVHGAPVRGDAPLPPRRAAVHACGGLRARGRVRARRERLRLARPAGHQGGPRRHGARQRGHAARRPPHAPHGRPVPDRAGVAQVEAGGPRPCGLHGCRRLLGDRVRDRQPGDAHRAAGGLGPPPRGGAGHGHPVRPRCRPRPARDRRAGRADPRPTERPAPCAEEDERRMSDENTRGNVPLGAAGSGAGRPSSRTRGTRTGWRTGTGRGTTRRREAEQPRALTRLALVDVGALVLMFAAVAIGFGPVWGSSGWVLPAAGGAGVGLAVAWVGAWRRVPAVTVTALAVVAYLLFGGALALPHTSIGGVVPTLDTLRELLLGAVEGW